MGCLQSALVGDASNRPVKSPVGGVHYPNFTRPRRFAMRAPDGASSSAIPRAELTRRREEFWDTSPSYGGSREIWDVLKAAVEAEDIHTARLFVESAGIIVVTPDMTCVFDERGAKYDIPRWVISDPTNVVGGAGTSRREEEEPDRTPEDPNVEEPDRTREDLNPEADESPNDAERRTIEAAAEAASEGDERRRARAVDVRVE